MNGFVSRRRSNRPAPDGEIGPASCLAPKRIKHLPGPFDPDRWVQDWQIDASRAKRRELLLAPVYGANQTDRIQEAIAESRHPLAAFHQHRFVSKPHIAKHPLKE